MAIILKGIFINFIVGQLFKLAQCQSHSQTCGSLFSEDDFDGKSITFFDMDQTNSFHDDPRFQFDNWTEIKSISVAKYCAMNICNQTYLTGQCRTLTHGQYSFPDVVVPNIASVSCLCETECSCENIYLKKSTCARAYLHGGCGRCNSLYIDLISTKEMEDMYQPNFPEAYSTNVTALRLRKGCALTIFSDEEQEDPTAIDSELVENFNGSIYSYECQCDDSQFVSRPISPRPEEYPPLIDIPTTLEEVMTMFYDVQYTNHPGLQAAHQTMTTGSERKRSSKNVYILLLGSTGSGKSTTINLLFDNPNVTRTGDGSSTTSAIHEFRIPLPIDELGVANSELRVIDTPGLGDTKGVGQDAKFLATLDHFLSTHEELKDRLPNVVLIFHKFSDNRFNGRGSSFVQMLRGFDTFRTRITDEAYSNVIFVLSHFCAEPPNTTRRPEKRLAQFKRVIEEFGQFPRPTLITVAENKPRENNLPMINGYAKLPNNEYYPRNLFEKLELLSEKCKDPIGLGVFRTAFRNSENFNITSITTNLLSNKAEKVPFYLGILSNSLIGVIDTDISKLLKQVWDEKLSPDLKRNNPESLPYLQKALNMREIHTLRDVPKTSAAILDLLTAIKHDDATRELTELALGIRPPVFPSDTIAGHGYNVFTDNYLPASPFVLGDMKPSDIGYLIPKSLSVNRDPGDKEHFHVFNDKHDYIQYRLQNLGITGKVSASSFTGTYKPGHNIKSIAFQNNSCSITATREVRLFEFKLNDKLDLTEEFKNTVRKLPEFNGSDHESVDAWNSFFNKYGTHVVNSIYGGGEIKIELNSKKPYDIELSNTLFDLIKFAEELSFLIVRNKNANQTGRGVIDSNIEHSLTFVGGDLAYHTTDLTKMSVDNAAKLLNNWKKSLKYHPSVLTTEMKLVPLGQIVKKLGQNYSSEIDRATSLLFDSALKYVPAKKIQESNPGLPRDQTPILKTLNDTIAANNVFILKIFDRMEKVEAERLKWQQEMENKRLDFENQERENNRKFQADMEKARAKLEADSRAFQLDMAEKERVEAQKREARQSQLQKEILQAQKDMTENNRKWLAEMAKNAADREDRREKELDRQRKASEAELQRLHKLLEDQKAEQRRFADEMQKQREAFENDLKHQEDHYNSKIERLLEGRRPRPEISFLPFIFGFRG